MPRTVRQKSFYSPAIREIEVVDAYDVTPGMRRIVFGGDHLRGYTTGDGIDVPEFRSDEFDDAVRFVFPAPGESEAALPVQGDGELIHPQDRRPMVRAYTVRYWDREAARLVVDFVRHGTGIASTWAVRCGVGDRAHIVGPHVTDAHPESIDHMLIVGDETALPAIGRWIEEHPTGQAATVIIEVGDAADRQDLTPGPEVDLRWLVRDGAPGGSTTLMLDEITGLDWPAGVVYAWIAGETLSLKPIRRHLVDDRGLPKNHLEVAGYWRTETVPTLADDPALPDASEEWAEDKFHEMCELLPPIALRVAVTLDVPEQLSRGVTRLDALAAATGTDAAALGKFLRYLITADLVEIEGDDYRLTNLGEQLTDDYYAKDLDLASPESLAERALFGLADAVRTGGSVYRDMFGVGYRELLGSHTSGRRYFADADEFANYIAPTLVTTDVFDGLGHVLVHADGATTYATQLAQTFPDLRITVVGMPAQIEHIRADLGDTITADPLFERIAFVGQSVFEELPDADGILLVSMMDKNPDADAVHLLRRLGGVGARLIVVEEPMQESQISDHDTMADLRNLAVYGSGFRTDAEHRALFERAGLTVAAAQHIYCGETVYTLA
ncbi:siderophore-interacting protein [Gordonia humi]|uniref:NADPH-dependent ferric siderophore reductase n=1 Tax=Gordonia humi TaxID=686429 RepID=A0A840F306_9ACTN|nr:siderophore-interacting protein [Gordonia humi]MBB4133957.1 NADPH-dependent ferric siderophore reductase [Gordonia humi]